MIKFQVQITNKAKKGVRKLPRRELVQFSLLVEDLETFGPELKQWSHYSKLGKVTHHCHIGYHWVATWRCEENSIIVEVEYVGSRENAPY